MKHLPPADQVDTGQHQQGENHVHWHFTDLQEVPLFAVIIPNGPRRLDEGPRQSASAGEGTGNAKVSGNL